MESLRGRTIRLARQIQGDHLPIHFQEVNEHRPSLPAAMRHWAERAHLHARLALLDFRIRRYKQWLEATSTCSPTA